MSNHKPPPIRSRVPSPRRALEIIRFLAQRSRGKSLTSARRWIAGIALMGLASLARAEEKAGLPPGWLPVARLDGAAAWGDVRKIADRIHLFLPDGAPVARGVFVCYVFHSADPREVARLWRFALRLPDEMPPAGKPVQLRPLARERGWVGDFNKIGEWVAIAPYAEAKGMVSPTWLPDAYGAWMWRSYHSSKPDLRIAQPAREYRKGGGPDCGLGYGGTLKAGASLTFAAEVEGGFTKVEFHDGDRIVGEAASAPWQVSGVKLERGLRALFAVGVAADGKRRASRPAIVVVE